jgi:long-chain acyl-CoA synthetase
MVSTPTRPTPIEQQNLARSVDYSSIARLPEMWAIAAQKFGGNIAVWDPHSSPEVKLTFGELYGLIQSFGAGLRDLGVQPGDSIALFSDNGPYWPIADQGIMTAGAINVVRGSQADAAELAFILDNSDSIGLIVQDKATLVKVRSAITPNLEQRLKFVILLSDETVSLDLACPLLTRSEVIARGAAAGPIASIPGHRDDVATLMYTSGTSGMPKGVMLTHGNLLSQVRSASAVLALDPGGLVLSILPIWHCYERTFEYFCFSQGCAQVYTNIRYVKKDLKTYQPQYMVAVPRLWESIYEGVQKQFRDQPESKQKLVNFFLAQSARYLKARRRSQGLDLESMNPSAIAKGVAALQTLAYWPIHQLGDRLVYGKVREAVGGKFRFAVSGGGSIADYLEDFYEIVGIEILGGYGLTETAPITHVRRPWRNLRGGDGQPLIDTEFQIVNPDSRQVVPTGQQGLVLIRGPQVMKGYYKLPDATAKAIDPQGWFDTGDLGYETAQRDLIITGRAKDTIVLTNGENIEPEPIEDACSRSPYVLQIVLVGQDQKYIGALIVPNRETIAASLSPADPTLKNPDTLDLERKDIQDLIRQELNREIKQRPGYRPDDQVKVFRLISDPFSVENGMLTQTLKVRRPVVVEQYRAMIDGMFSA